MSSSPARVDVDSIQARAFPDQPTPAADITEFTIYITEHPADITEFTTDTTGPPADISEPPADITARTVDISDRR